MSFCGQHVHLVGIGGAGLSAIARVLLQQGARVSGSDRAVSAFVPGLVREGAQVFIGHRAENVAGADLVVLSSAVSDDNVELLAAQEVGVPVLRRPDFLRRLMEGQTVVAVAGTHGKTTTTAMLATTLLDAGLDPSFIVGGEIVTLETNARAGQGPVFIIEADEYAHTFLSLAPKVAVITNVEHDHPDCYPTFDAFRQAFESFAALVPSDGLLVVCWDDPVAREIGLQRQAAGTPVVFYGLDPGGESWRAAATPREADGALSTTFDGTVSGPDPVMARTVAWRAEELRPNFAGGTDFLAVHRQRTLGLLRLRLPGAHNVSNALAALVVSDFLGVPFSSARVSLREFRGTGRRFEIKGEADGVMVVDDYAHHPTEIRATLAAGRQVFQGRPLWAVWQPHTYSRTRLLLADFAAAFDLADHVIVLPIYAAREPQEPGFDSATVVGAMVHPDVRCVASREEAVVLLAECVRAGDVVLTLGAGDGDKVGQWLLTALRDGLEGEADG